LKIRYKGAQKMAKDWLRKFKNQRLRFDNIFFFIDESPVDKENLI
jgi:hypothetical protein